MTNWHIALLAVMGGGAVGVLVLVAVLWRVLVPA